MVQLNCNWLPNFTQLQRRAQTSLELERSKAAAADEGEEGGGGAAAARVWEAENAQLEALFAVETMSSESVSRTPSEDDDEDARVSAAAGAE